MWILRIRVQKAYDPCTAGRPRSNPSRRNSGSACSQPPSGAISTEVSHRSGRWRATSSDPPVRRAACFAVTSFTASSCREATPACSVHPARLRICLDASICRSRLTASSGSPRPSTARPCPPEWPGKTDPMDGRAPSPPAHPPAAGPRLRTRRTSHGHGLDLDPVRVPELAVGIGHIQKSPGTLRTPGKYAPWPDSGRVPPLSLRLSGRAAPFRKPASWAAGFLQSADSPHFLCLNLISLGSPEASRTVRFQMRLRVR